ncbi:MAG: hypothetical protein ABIL39_11045 [candidate division WOR-3 bacterium]
MIVDGIFEPGNYTYNLNSGHYNSGIYFLILAGEREKKSQKIMIVR